MAGGLGLFGFGGNAAQTLGDAGYKTTNYSTDNTGLDYSGAFKGYGATQGQAADIGAAGATPYNAAQLGLMKQLQGQAAGTSGPTMADQQLQAGLQSGLASTLAATAGGRGGQSPGAGAEAARRNQTGMALGAAGAAGAQRAGEQMSAEQQLAGVTGQGQAEAQAQATLQQQTALANQQAQNQAAQFGSTAQQSLAGLQNQNWQFGTGLNAQEANAYNQAVYGLTAGAQASQQQEATTGFNAAVIPGAGLSSSSDETAKKDISDSEDQMQGFLSALGNVSAPPAPIAQHSAGEGTSSAGAAQGIYGGVSSAIGGGGAAGGAGGGLSGIAEVAALAKGGKTTKPTTALVGEKGPEVVSYPESPNTTIPNPQHVSRPPMQGLDTVGVGGDVQHVAPQFATQANSSVPPTAGMSVDLQGNRSMFIPGGMDLTGVQAGPPPQVAAMAKGGTTPAPTTAVVGEKGPEVVNLPAHATVIPNDKSQGLLRAMGHADHSYQYKDPNAPGAAPGTHYGPMAQELEKDPVGASTVVQGPDGKKQVDGSRLALALASATGVLNNRVTALEHGFAAAHRQKKKGKG